MTSQFNQLSIELTKKLSVKDKKDNGIYFTPMDIVKLTIDSLIKYNKNIVNILEPSCGSCQYIDYIDSVLKNTNITGIEYNKTIYDSIKDKTLCEENNNKLNIINKDYLEYGSENANGYDLIVGNPPYYVMKAKDVKLNKKECTKYYEGRTNIFILFIIHSLKKLNKNGILAFVLPKSFTNCIYYSKLRHHIYDEYCILNIIDCSDSSYLETKQDTIVLIIQKSNDVSNNHKYNLNKDGMFILNTKDNILKLKELYQNSYSLNFLGFDVSVGNVVWNEEKTLLTDDNTKTRLIYSSDIKNNKLQLTSYKNAEKKNYINKKGDIGNVLVVNRGYGVGTYKFEYALIDIDDTKYLIENHLICIKYKNENAETNEEIKKRYEKVMKSFTNPKTLEFINMYFGNNAINTKELQYVMPIYYNFANE
jgi:type I restriction-modification system DNA methylase subunit